MYRPEDVRARLGVSPTTLRRYAVAFEAWLSASARPSLTEQGATGARRYTAADLGVLAAVKRAYDAGLSTAEIQARLHDGALPPVAVADDNTPWPPLEPPKAATVGLEAATVDLLALVGGDLAAFLAQMQQLERMAPALAQTLGAAQEERVEAAAAAERQRAELEAVLAEQRAALAALREEREALAALRAEIAAERNHPEVPVARVTVGQRLRRLFTRES